MNKQHTIKKIAVLTSGGDAPGMNAAIRAVTRTAINNKLEVIGILDGYQGLINLNFIPLFSQSVSGIIQCGGTILRSARCKEFETYEGRARAIQNLKQQNIDALIVIGGDGTFRGANELVHEFDFPVIGIPGTIDNDIHGTEYTIGFDTCLNTVVQSVDKIRDTGSSHNRVFFVEVMGHKSGHVALYSGVACGAEIILIPEQKKQLQKTREFLSKRAHKNKLNLIMVSEGLEDGSAMEIADKMKNEFPQFDIRVTVLGYIQRGGSPTATDRIQASELGVAAVHALLKGEYGIMVGLLNNQINYVSFKTAVSSHHALNKEFIKIAEGIGTYTPIE